MTSFINLHLIQRSGAAVNAEHVMHIARRFIDEKTRSWNVEDVVRAEFGEVWQSWDSQTRRQRLSDFEVLRIAAQRHGMDWIEHVMAHASEIGGRTKERIKVGMRYLAHHYTADNATLRQCMIDMKVGLRNR